MILSAKGIKNVKHITKMHVYVVVKITGDPNSEKKTNVDETGGCNPTWNFPVQFIIDEVSARSNNQALIFQLRCNRNVRGDKDVGEVKVPLIELLDNTVDNKSTKVVSYPVKEPSGSSKGGLKFSYKFGERGMSGEGAGLCPPAGYPPVGVGLPVGYPPAGYPPIGQPPFGYPGSPSAAAPQYGFQVVQPQRTNELVLEQEVEAAVIRVLSALLTQEQVAEELDDSDPKC